MTSYVIDKLWNYCHILRDDGLSYGDYVEQSTFLLFLKMADEQSRPPFNKKSPIPEKYSWPELLNRDGDKLEILYRRSGNSCRRAESAERPNTVGCAACSGRTQWRQMQRPLAPGPPNASLQFLIYI